MGGRKRDGGRDGGWGKEDEGGGSGAGPHCYLSSCTSHRSCPVLVALCLHALVVVLSFCILVVLSSSCIVVVPGVSELGWDELGTGVLTSHRLGAMSPTATWHTFCMCPLAVSLCMVFVHVRFGAFIVVWVVVFIVWVIVAARRSWVVVGIGCCVVVVGELALIEWVTWPGS